MTSIFEGKNPPIPQNHHILREFQVPTLFRKRDVVQTPHPGKANKSEMKQQKSRLKMLQKD